MYRAWSGLGTGDGQGHVTGGVGARNGETGRKESQGVRSRLPGGEPYLQGPGRPVGQ